MGKPAVKATAPKKKSIKKQLSKAAAKERIGNSSDKKKKTFYRQNKFKRSIDSAKEGRNFNIFNPFGQ